MGSLRGDLHSKVGPLREADTQVEVFIAGFLGLVRFYLVLSEHRERLRTPVGQVLTAQSGLKSRPRCSDVRAYSSVG